MSSTKIGSSIAQDIAYSSRGAVILSLISIFLYILIRFRKIGFGVGALVALFHDILIVFSAIAIAGVLGFQIEIDQVFIAAILTMIGYSINDTVVVFDRIREFIGIKSDKPIRNVINTSINRTLNRTLITSFTTLLVVVVLLTFGGEVLRGFSFTLLVGILVGTYSSIFIASSLVYDSSLYIEEKKI